MSQKVFHVVFVSAAYIIKLTCRYVLLVIWDRTLSLVDRTLSWEDRTSFVRIMNIVILILGLLLFYYRIKRRSLLSLHHFNKSTHHNHVMVECTFMYEQ